MRSETQAILLNAVPLLVVGGLYLLAAATLVPVPGVGGAGSARSSSRSP